MKNNKKKSSAIILSIVIFAAIIAFGDYSYTPLVQDYNTRNKGDNNPYEY